MVLKLSIILLTAFLPKLISAHVIVYHATNCRQALQKSVEGLRLSLGDDPTLNEPEEMTLKTYREEVYSSLEVVHNAYKDIFLELEAEGEMLKGEAQATLEKIISTDKKRFETNKNENSIDNTVYFIWKTKDGKVASVLRATFIKVDEATSQEKRKLNIESSVSLPNENRIELERYDNTSSPRPDITSREIMMVVALYAKKRFGSNNYKIYAQTNLARARLYRKCYGFTIEKIPNQIPAMSYKVEETGDTFYDRWVGHVETAYNIAFSQAFEPVCALNLLRKYEQRPGMKNYIPNLVAQSVILASQKKYIEAVEVTEQLRAIGHAEINLDYNILWRARATYDNIAGKGDTAGSANILKNYLKDHPLDNLKYTDRSLLFLVFELKNLLSEERFEEAEVLINTSKNILQEGLHRQSHLFRTQWKWVECSSRRIPDTAFVLINHIFLMWDLSTHMDPFSTSVLRPETYEVTARAFRSLRQNEKANHFAKIGSWLKNVF